MREIDQPEDAEDQSEADGAEPDIAAGDEAVDGRLRCRRRARSRAKAEKTRTTAASNKSPVADRRTECGGGRTIASAPRARGSLNPRESLLHVDLLRP